MRRRVGRGGGCRFAKSSQNSELRSAWSIITSAARVRNAPIEWVWSGRFVIFYRTTFWKGFMELKFVPLWNTGVRFGAEITFQCFGSYRTVSAEEIKSSFHQYKQDSITLLCCYFSRSKNKLAPPYPQRLLPQACGASSQYHLRGHKFPVSTVRSTRALMKAFLPRSMNCPQTFRHS